MESIALYFTPLLSTKIVAAFGLGLAYHTGIVYTNGAGQSFGVTSGPSDFRTQQTPRLALDAAIASMSNRPSAYGIILPDPHNNRPFIKGRPEDYFTQNATGDEYPHIVVREGRDLSTTWRAIVASYRDMGQAHFTYSPISQNSNSMAGTALRRAGLPIPFSSATMFAPGTFTNLMRSRPDL